MQIRSSILRLAIAGAFAAPLTALGQGSTGSLSEEDFRKYDADRDGVISRSEWNQVRQAAQQQGQPGQRQTRAGQQQGQSGQQQRSQQAQGAGSQQGQRGDGQWVVVTVTPVEQKIMDEQRRESLFRALDANGNGMISATEAGLNVQLLGAFTELDRNRNGMIERQEFASVQVQQDQGAAAGGTGSSSGASSGSSR